MDIKQLLTKAIEASLLAGDEILKVYNTGFEVEQKAEYEDGMYKLLEYLEKYKPKNTDSTTFVIF